MIPRAIEQRTTSIRPDNKYKLHCPVIGEDSYFLACDFRRYLTWRGEVEKVDKPECVYCMRASKCPAVKMMHQEWKEGEALFFDASGDKTHEIPLAIYEDMKRVMADRSFASGIDVPPEKFERIVSDQMDPHSGSKNEPKRSRLPRQVAPEPSEPADTGNSLTDALANATVNTTDLLNKGL